MKDTGTILSKATNLILSIAFSFSMVYALTTTLAFAFKPFEIIIYIAIIHLVLAMMFRNRFSMAIAGITFGIILFVFLIFLLFGNNFARLINWVRGYASWFTGYISGIEAISNTLALFTALLICIGISVWTFFFSYKAYNFYVLLTSGSLLFVIQHMLKYYTSDLSFYLFLLLIVIYYFIYIYNRKIRTEPGKYVEPHVFTLNVLFVSALVFTISVLIPKQEYPIQWPWLDKKITTFYNRITAPTYEFFSLASTGFGEDEVSLGGKVSKDQTHTLTVDSPRAVYLKGAVLDTYTGSSWQNSDSDYQDFGKIDNGVKMDLLELVVAGMLSRDNNFIEKYFYIDEIKITYEKIRTKTLFFPLKTIELSQDATENNEIFVTRNDAIFLNKYLSYGSSYSLTAYTPKYNDKEFQNMMRKSYRGFYSDLLAQNKNYDIKINTYNNFSNRNSLPKPDENLYGIIEALKSNADEIYERYLTLPKDLPRRVHDLARRITSNIYSNYDIAKSIEKYLSQMYRYTLEPEKSEPGQDFVDYFLFESREGYCTYFATSMVVLARAVGLPARYVEGYMLPRIPESGITYRVTNENAHAWAEIYFEGFGWLAFEPTAPFISNFYTDYYTGTVTSEYSYEDFIEEYIDEYINEFDQISKNESNNETDTSSPDGNNLLLTIIILIAITAFIAIYLGIAVLRVNLRIYRFGKMEPGKSVRSMYHFYLQVLDFQDLGRKPGETPYQYAERIDGSLVFPNIKFSAITEIFVKARYSKKAITEKERSELLEFYKDLIYETKDNIGVIRYLAARYLLGQF
ncbi:MAG TPA: transglutaminase domain-containing protein [Clostridiaceae bacterium]|nr:transglutaminase domain-containing protein [Clostridiaceae bacterium]